MNVVVKLKQHCCIAHKHKDCNCEGIYSKCKFKVTTTTTNQKTTQKLFIK